MKNIIKNAVGLESEVHVLFNDEIMDNSLQTKCACMLVAAIRDIYGYSYGNHKAHCPHADLICSGNEYLTNGARVYLDHCYVEYATALFENTVEAVAAIKAGDEIVRSAARKVQKAVRSHPQVLTVRNNIDNRGHSYGAHVNIRMTRKGYESIFADENLLKGFVIPFFISLPLICGAGRCGSEKGENIFAIWQRSDFIKELVNLQTTFDRPLVNTRDESLSADPEHYARFHIIAFDANRLEIAEYLKLGLLRLLCAAIDAEKIAVKLELTDPLKAVSDVSRNPFTHLLLSNDKTITPLEIQREFQAAFTKLHDLGVFKSRVPDSAEILTCWEQVLTKLERDSFELVGSLDWITKYVWLEQIRDHSNLQWPAPQMQWFDIMYHCLTGGKSPNVPCVTITKKEQIEKLIGKAPGNSRAELRGKLLHRFGHEISNANWHWLVNECGDKAYLLPDEPEPGIVEVLNRTNNLEDAAYLLELKYLHLAQKGSRKLNNIVKDLNFNLKCNKTQVAKPIAFNVR